MKTWHVWSEGYVTNGAESDATYHGAVEAETFEGACLSLARVNAGFASEFEPDRMTLWGCRLFDNEANARRAYG